MLPKETFRPPFVGGGMADGVPLILNAGGGAMLRGGEELAGRVQQALAAAGVAAQAIRVDGARLIDAVTEVAAASPPLLIAGGGDGTLSSVAGVLADGNVPLAILPLGTLNHLARDLGIPGDIDEAAAVIAAGRTTRIDLGEVNGRAFVNNCSIGIYPAWVRDRDVERRRGLPKWLASVPAAWRTLARLRHHRLRVTIEGNPTRIVTPLLFVGNNAYSLDPGALGQRRSLQDGLLSVHALKNCTRLGLVAFAARLLVGRIDSDRDFALVGEGAAVTVEAHARSIALGIDGEYVRLRAPLRFRIRPGALPVIVSEAAAA